MPLGEPVAVVCLWTRCYALVRAIFWVAQSPAGRTRHRVLVGDRRGDLRQVAVLAGDSADGDILTVDLDPNEGADVRFVRIETTASPSWVAWREVRIFSR